MKRDGSPGPTRLNVRATLAESPSVCGSAVVSSVCASLLRPYSVEGRVSSRSVSGRGPRRPVLRGRSDGQEPGAPTSGLHQAEGEAERRADVGPPEVGRRRGWRRTGQMDHPVGLRRAASDGHCRGIGDIERLERVERKPRRRADVNANRARTIRERRR